MPRVGTSAAIPGKGVLASKAIAEDDRPEASPPDRRRREARDPAPPRQRKRRPERQLPSAAEGREVGGSGLLVGELDSERERADQDERERYPDRGRTEPPRRRQSQVAASIRVGQTT